MWSSICRHLFSNARGGGKYPTLPPPLRAPMCTISCQMYILGIIYVKLGSKVLHQNCICITLMFCWCIHIIIHSCSVRVVSPSLLLLLELSRQAFCGENLSLCHDDAVTGTVCATPPPHIMGTGALQPCAENRFENGLMGH